MEPRRLVVLASLLVTVSCAGSEETGPGAPDAGSSEVADAGGNPSDAGGASQECLAATLLESLGKSSLLIGASMADATANQAPFEVRYLYLAGGLFDSDEPCASCASGCTAGGVSCSNAVGCGWWGCWQWDQDPPGKYVADFVAKTGKATYAGKAHPQIPMITYYENLHGSGAPEGTAQVGAMNDPAFLHRYFGDFRLVLKKIGAKQALVHIEPDLWGYVQHAGPDPHAMPAPVAAANPTDCSGQESSVAGVARCLVAMTRKYAPNAKVGLHASAWATKIDVLMNTNPSLDVKGEGEKLGGVLLELGAGEGDFGAADMSDRDAGFYEQQGRNSWWDSTNAKLPNFRQAFTWAKAVSDTVGKPIVWWQIPVGNMQGDDTANHYRDNRVDYLFAHLDEVVAANGAGLFFGAGEGQQTNPETDGGNLVARVKAAVPRASCP